MYSLTNLQKLVRDMSVGTHDVEDAFQGLIFLQKLIEDVSVGTSYSPCI